MQSAVQRAEGEVYLTGMRSVGSSNGRERVKHRGGRKVWGLKKGFGGVKGSFLNYLVWTVTQVGTAR